MATASYSKFNRYANIGKRLLREAQEELDNGDTIQSSEKAWGAAAYAVKSVAEKWGWYHQSHLRLRATVAYIAYERGRRDLHVLYNALENIHKNYYEDEWDTDEVQVGIDTARTFTEEMDKIRNEAVPTFPSLDELSAPQRRRLRMLTTRPRHQDVSIDDLEFLPPVEPEPPETR